MLTAHVVTGEPSLTELHAKVGKDGHANLDTLSGKALPVKVRGDKALVHSENRIIDTIADVDPTKGMIQVNDAVPVPE